MFNLHDLYAADVVPIYCTSVRVCLENSLMRIHVKVKIKLEYASL